jgi:hypothetical protein
MRSRLAIAICIGAIGIPAVAFGGPPLDPEYGGKIDKKQNRYIGFDIKGRGDDRKLQNMFIRNVPFHDCDDPADDGKDGGSFEGKFPIRQGGKFGGTKTDLFNARGIASGITYTLKGTLDGNRADGTLKMKLLGTNCRSGEVDWKARKPAPPVPQS